MQAGTALVGKSDFDTYSSSYTALLSGAQNSVITGSIMQSDLPMAKKLSEISIMRLTMSLVIHLTENLNKSDL